MAMGPGDRGFGIVSAGRHTFRLGIRRRRGDVFHRLVGRAVFADRPIESCVNTMDLTRCFISAAMRMALRQ